MSRDRKADPSAGAEPPAGDMARQWHYRPDVPIAVSPFMSRPLSPLRMVKWVAQRWLRIAENSILLILAVFCWMYLQPPLEQMRTLDWAPVLQMYARNLGLMILIAGGLHLYFFVLKCQGSARRFDDRPLKTGAKGFQFGNQVRDNMFWTLGSGVFFWTAYEVLMLWAMANGFVPVLQWQDDPLLFAAMLFVTPMWISFHFYWVHRWLHWPPAYRWVHALHHRNTNVGPWSGLSMHPVEHLVFFSSVLVHFLIAAHPVHILFHMQHQALTAATSHTGYEGLFKGGRMWLALGTFHHQMHHRYFECNYGNLEVPLDRWFGTFHDGSEASHLAMKARRRAEARAGS